MLLNSVDKVAISLLYLDGMYQVTVLPAAENSYNTMIPCMHALLQ